MRQSDCCQDVYKLKAGEKSVDCEKQVRSPSIAGPVARVFGTNIDTVVVVQVGR